jgi:hypothetical protein
MEFYGQNVYLDAERSVIIASAPLSIRSAILCGQLRIMPAIRSQCHQGVYRLMPRSIALVDGGIPCKKTVARAIAAWHVYSRFVL